MNTDLVDDKEVIFVFETSYPITSTVVISMNPKYSAQNNNQPRIY